jgi:protein SCO1/2
LSLPGPKYGIIYAVKTPTLHPKTTIAVLLSLILTVAALFAWRSESEVIVKAPDEIEDYLFWEAKELADFKLTAAGNKTFNLDNMKGKWSFIFFGYTHCPDICPTTLMQMGAAFKLLEYDPAIYPEIQGIFISVDPDRDTPELLKDYVRYFNPGFIGLTDNKVRIDAFSRQIGALYKLNNEESKDDYEVTHNSTIFLIDPKGRLYGRFSPPQAAPEIASKFIRIRKFYMQQEEKRWSLF